MSKDAISDYSATAGSNTDVGGVNIDEGMSPSGVNNAIRELMSHLADLNAGTSSLGTIKVDNLQLDSNTISSTNTNGNITLTPNGNGLVSIADGDLQIGSTTVSATGAELNLMDGDTSPGTTAVAGSDGIVTNDNSTMRQTTVDTFDTYLSQTTKTLTNKSISGASNTITAVPLTALDIDGGTATTTLADADLLIVDDGAGGTNRKITAANAKTYFGGGSASAPTALSGTSTAIDWSANSQFTHTLSGDTTYTYSNISAGSSIELYLKNVGKRFDLLQQNSRTDPSFSGQIATSGEDLQGSFFNDDGSKFYLVEDAGNIPIHEYNLSTNYLLTSASHVQSKDMSSTNAQKGGQFNADGSKLILIRGDDLHEHALTSNYNISTINTTAANSVNLDTVLGDSGGTGLLFSTGRFNSNGTKLFLANQRHGNSSSNDFTSHFVITLSSAYDITSTLALESSFDVGTDLAAFGGGGKTGFIQSDISADGTNMVVIEETVSSGETKIHHYFLESGFDLRTIKRVGTSTYTCADSNAATIEHIRILENDDSYYVSEHTTSGATANNQKLRVYSIEGDHKVTFPTVTSTKPQNLGSGADPTTTSFLRLTSNDGTNVLITDHREIT